MPINAPRRAGCPNALYLKTMGMIEISPINATKIKPKSFKKVKIKLKQTVRTSVRVSIGKNTSKRSFQVEYFVGKI